MRRLLLPVMLTAACAADARPREVEAGTDAEVCRVSQPARTLPAELVESSGIAPSRKHAGLFWTHNDSGSGATVFGVRADGQLVTRVRIPGVESVDWEDIAVAPCPAGSCLYIADTGNNRGGNRELTVYRVREPESQRSADGAERFPVRLPRGESDDVEALFVLPGGEVFLVTKGTRRPPTLYRYPPPLRAGETVELHAVARLSDRRSKLPDQVTGASASPSGRWVAIRTYAHLALYRASDLTAGRVRPAQTFGLGPLGQAQGEAVALLDDGRLVLTSEGGDGGPASIAALTCRLPRG